MSEGGGSSQISTSEHQESRYQPQNANQSSINHHNYHAERNGSVVGMKDQQDRERKESGLQRRLSKIPRPFGKSGLNFETIFIGTQVCMLFSFLPPFISLI